MIPDDKKENFDIVIIGSGLGGLVCGTILGKEGFKVCVIEKNPQIGGNLQTFRREGIKFDTGVHYLGGLGKGQNLNKLFTYLGIMDKLKLTKLDEEGFDVVLFKNDKQEYPYGMGYENFIRIMAEKFPEEKDTIVKYCNELQRICNNFPLYNIKEGEEYGDKDMFTRGAKEYINSLTTNKKLRNALAGTNILYAGIGDKTPLYIHALIINSYIESSWRCAEGGDQIAKLLGKEIRHAGGVIMRGKAVTTICSGDDKIECVVLDNGEKIFGKHFISNLHPAQTLEMLDKSMLRPAYKSRIQNLKNSISAFVVYLVLKPNRRKYQNRNYYCFDGDDIWDGVNYTEDAWPNYYGIYECVPKYQSEYVEALSIIGYMRFDEVQQWANTHNRVLAESDRGKDYEAFKTAKAEKLLNAVEQHFPGLKDDIQSYYTATPLSYRDYIGTSDGNIYGIERDYNEPILTRISPRTKITNLYFTGQNVNLHGVLGVTIGAVLTCSILLGKGYIINKINEANETRT